MHNLSDDRLRPANGVSGPSDRKPLLVKDLDPNPCRESIVLSVYGARTHQERENSK